MKVEAGTADLQVVVRGYEFMASIWRYGHQSWQVSVRSLTTVAGVHVQEGTAAKTWAEAYRKALRIAERIAPRRET